MSPEYLRWGITLWTAYRIVIIQRHEPSGTEPDQSVFSRKAAVVVALMGLFMIVAWPVTITIALLKETVRTP